MQKWSMAKNKKYMKSNSNFKKVLKICELLKATVLYNQLSYTCYVEKIWVTFRSEDCANVSLSAQCLNLFRIHSYWLWSLRLTMAVVDAGERRPSFVCERSPVHSSQKKILGCKAFEYLRVRQYSYFLYCSRWLELCVDLSSDLLQTKKNTSSLSERDWCLWLDRGPFVLPSPRSRKLRNAPPLRWSATFSRVRDCASVQPHKRFWYYVSVLSYFFWRNSPQWSRASSFTMFVDHTKRCITVGRTLLDEWLARRRDLFLTKYITYNRQTSMPPVRFELNLRRWEAADLRLRPLGHCERQLCILLSVKYESVPQISVNWVYVPLC
jgi:hypothetical protein